MKKVKIYSTSTCGSCAMAKKFMKEEGIEFDEHLVDKDEDAKSVLINAGVTSLPFIVIGDVEISGFDKEAILKASKE